MQQKTQSHNVFRAVSVPLVYTQNNASGASINASSEFKNQALTLNQMREILNKPQSFFIKNGKITIIDEETGEVKSQENMNSRAERWALKAAVNKLLPRSRTYKCHKWVVPNMKPTIYRHVKDGESKAFYGGLEVCGSVWACPVCAAKIAERRREELAQAIQEAKKQGLTVSMLTLTTPHYKGEDLAGLLARMTAAYTKLWKDTAGQRLINKYGIEGRIRAFEVTYGENGFHPHFHVLLFSNQEKQNPSLMEDDFYSVWLNCCTKKGLGAPSKKHGVRVDLANDAVGSYVAKWGLDCEMTKSHIKRAKHGYSMNDLLRSFLAGDDDAGKIWKIYAMAFKGKRQLVWSNGLKDRLLIAETSDDELATAQIEDASVFADLTLEQWRAVYRTKSEHYLLNCVEKAPERFYDLIRSLVDLNRSMDVSLPTNARDVHLRNMRGGRQRRIKKIK